MESWVNRFTQQNSERCRKRDMFYTRNNRTVFPGVPFLSFPGCGLCSRLTRAIVQQVRFGGAHRRMWYRRRASRNCKPPAGRRLPSNGIVFTACPISNFYARIILSRRGIELSWDLTKYSGIPTEQARRKGDLLSTSILLHDTNGTRKTMTASLVITATEQGQNWTPRSVAPPI